MASIMNQICSEKISIKKSMFIVSKNYIYAVENSDT
jgi:hypothetical protein